MPIPFLNILNGGAHAENSSDFQEYKIAAVGASDFREAFRWSSEVFHALKTLLHERHLRTTVGDEGGFAPSLGSNQEYVEVILLAIEKAGYQPGKDFYLALDPALFRGGQISPETRRKSLVFNGDDRLLGSVDHQISDHFAGRRSGGR
jgi:enolase